MAKNETTMVAGAGVKAGRIAWQFQCRRKSRRGKCSGRFQFRN
jgi:hypothetical protein